MSLFRRFVRLRTCLPVIGTTQPARCKVTDVKDVVQWKFVEQPSKLTPSYTGDLAPSEPVDLSQPQSAIQAAKEEFEKTDETTRRVLSLEFARNREKTKQLEDKAVAFIQRHRFDLESPEAKVARLTAKIRRYQQLLQEPEYYRKSPLVRHQLHNMTLQRAGQLRRLRETDYRRFEWLLEQMQLVYRPPLPHGTDTTLSVKGGIRRMVRIFADGIRQEKLDALRRQFEAERPAFEEERREACRWIAAEEQALGLPPSVDPEKGRLLEERLPKRVVIPPKRDHVAV